MSRYTFSQTLKLWSMHAGLLAIVLLTGLVASTSSADTKPGSHEQNESLSFALDGRDFVLRNLVGEVEIVQARGNELRIESTIVADNKDDLGKVEIITIEESGVVEIRTSYPVEDYEYFFYQPRNDRSSTNSTVRYQNEKVRVGTKRNANKSIAIHVDYKIYVPERTELKIALAAGSISASDVIADMRINTKSGGATTSNTRGVLIMDTGSGPLTAADHVGRLALDTGSGDIAASGVSGDVHADTGSGEISLERITGDIDADTGSGAVVIVDATGEVNVDTGSGSIDLDLVSGSIKADTGSGSIEVTNWLGGRELMLDTGSGSVRANGDMAGVQRLVIDSGSGDIRLVSSSIPSLRLDISAHNIDVDLPQMTDVNKSKRRLRATVGGGAGRASIDTGSGTVSFKQR